MAVYAIGDIQGCFSELQRALDKVAFDPSKDQIWFAGDLVNRGPDSLAVLRFVRSLGDAAISVLGNHDLHLLAMAAGNTSKAGRDSLQEILQAPDRDELLIWLRYRPLLHHDPQLDFAMLHAGLPPQWTMAFAKARAAEVEAVLRSPDHVAYFHHMYGNEPKSWDDQLEGMDRLRFITNCLTRLRFCTAEGKLALKEKGPPGTQKRDHTLPWFDHLHRNSADTRIVFGHWSTLGYVARHNIWAIDTGCLWGGDLTLLRLDGDKPKPIHYSCAGAQDPALFA